MHEIRSALVRKERHVPLAAKSSTRGTGGGGLAGVRIRREEARTSDQRREDRHAGVVDHAVLRYRRRTYEVPVLNVSAHGAMIRSDLRPGIGSRVEIRFADCNWTLCHVRWLRDGRIGLEFEKETLIIGANDSGRRLVSGRRAGEHPTIAIRSQRAPRHHLFLRGELHWRSGSMPVRLRNISTHGAMLEGDQDIDPPAPVVLELADGVVAEGVVRWCRSRQIGVRFDQPFDSAALATHRGTPPAREDL